MLTVSTFNIKNDYNTYDPNKAKEIYNFLEKEKIDILCLQEVYDKCSNDLNKCLTNNYKMFGKYRFKLSILRKINEKTPIITNLGKTTKTFHLPFLPSLLKRIITRVVVDSEYGKIAIYNTHLDYKYEIVKKRQLKKILKILRKEKLPMIVVGDFNIKINKEYFKEFINEMKTLGLNRIALNEKTLKQSKYNRAIDHIFIDNSFKIIDKKVIKYLDISDHYPLLIKIKKDD